MAFSCTRPATEAAPSAEMESFVALLLRADSFIMLAVASNDHVILKRSWAPGTSAKVLQWAGAVQQVSHDHITRQLLPFGVEVVPITPQLADPPTEWRLCPSSTLRMHCMLRGPVQLPSHHARHLAHCASL